MPIVKDGTGSGKLAKVDATNRLATRSIFSTQQQEGAENGDAYNINTGDIALTTAGASAIMWFKNTGARAFHVDAIAAGIGTLPSPAEVTTLTLVRNPTAGTIVDNTLAVAMNENRNFGSSNALSATVYKGAEGYTFTDGDDIAQFYVAAGNARLFANIDFVIPQFSSLGFKIDINDSTGGIVYCALVGHLEAIT
jgi:hypothetical protein